ncbi:MAG TPA: hypothetical protein PKO15_10580 [Fibrobacteria bacterium]|nr:hypothetical protein [Fibrobacteria bacterium]HOX51796.1 hypothetical protein [Fibrobacteria bacterium]
MNRKPFPMSIVLVLLSTAVAVFAWPKGDRSRGIDPRNRIDRMMEERLASLSAPEQALAKALRPLQDSLGRTLHDYARKVGEGAEPRSLTVERARIQALKAEISRLEAADPEVSLDLLAHLPPPMLAGGRKPPRPPCPRLDDSTRPPCRHHAMPQPKD